MSTKLFIGNLSFRVTDHELRDAFAAHAVISADVVRDKFTGTSRGFGFVEVATEQQATAAVRAMSGHVLSGRPIRVELANGKGPNGGGIHRENVQRFRD